MPRSLARIPVWVLIAAAYGLLAVVALWDLVIDLRSAVPGGNQTDFYHFIWNYWWIGHALGEGISPAVTDYVLHPLTHDLSLHTLTPVWFPVYALVEPLAGRVAALNTLIVLSFVLSGTLTYAFLRRLLGEGLRASALAFAAGAAVTFQPFTLQSAAVAHLNILGAWWSPLLCLLWAEIVRPSCLPRPLTAALIGLAIWGALLTDLQYALNLPLTAGVYGLWTLWALRRDLPQLRRSLGWALVAFAIGLLLAYGVWPLRHILALDTGNPYAYPPAGLDTARIYAIAPEALIGTAIGIEGRSLGHLLPWLALIGLAALLWRLVRARRADESPSASPDRPPALLWLAAAIIPLLLMLGPDITLAGQTITLPYHGLHRLLDGQYRTPMRFVVPATFLLVTFTVSAWERVTSRLPMGREALLAGAALAAGAAVFIDAGALRAVPTLTLPDQYAIHRAIGRDDRDYAILDVPAGIHYGWTGIGPGKWSQFYAPIHQHPTVNGFLARIPYGDYATFADSPLFRWLAGLTAPDAAEQTAIAAEFQTNLADWPIGYVFAYRMWMSESQQNMWIGWINAQPGLCPPQIAPDGMVLWWRAQTLGCDPITPATEIDLGAPDDWLSIGPGWHQPEIIGGPDGRWASQEAALRVDVDPVAAYTLTLRAVAFDSAVDLTVGDQTITIAAGDWADYTLAVPPGTIRDRLLTLTHSRAVSPADLGLSPDTRQLAAAYALITFTREESTD